MFTISQKQGEMYINYLLIAIFSQQSLVRVVYESPIMFRGALEVVEAMVNLVDW